MSFYALISIKIPGYCSLIFVFFVCWLLLIDKFVRLSWYSSFETPYLIGMV